MKQTSLKNESYLMKNSLIDENKLIAPPMKYNRGNILKARYMPDLKLPNKNQNSTEFQAGFSHQN